MMKLLGVVGLGVAAMTAALDAYAAGITRVGAINGEPDLFIGTEGEGHVTPAACVPFGMVQAGPDTGIGAWRYCGGYQYSDDTVIGFSQTHLSGTGCPDLGDVSVLPFTGTFDEPLVSRFRKEDERAGPGWYETRLQRFGVGVEVTATEHVGLYSFAYPTGTAARVCVNLPFAIHYPQSPGFAHCRWHAAESRFADPATLVGTYERTVWNRRKVGFAVRFDRPPVAVREVKPVEGIAPSRYLLDFDLPEGVPLRMKVALSATDADAALRNLAAEASGWDFAALRRRAEEKWNEVLSRVRVEGDPRIVTSFYTALYRLFVQPNLLSDSGTAPRYSTFSCWDTFRAAHPLYTILAPEKVPDFVDSLLAQGRQTGFLPIWPLWGTDNQCMIATHSVPIIVDAWLKRLWPVNASRGGRDGTVEDAYLQIRDTLTKPHANRHKEQWELLDRYGYFPFDIVKGESVSRTLECAYDDWCAAQLAERLGKDGDAAFFRKRAGNWRNVLDPQTGLMRGRDSAGAWREPFDPFAIGFGAKSGNDFTEGNAWQYTWHVLHDPEGLVAAMGGRKAFADRLESLFRQDAAAVGTSANRNVAGFIGQYAHGNEPSHHVIYLFQYAGRGDLTAKYVREVFDTQYKTMPDGLSGNDDCGQMSAWYVFSALGFYPLNPCGGEYVIGAPQVEKAEVRVGGLDQRRTFRVLAKGLSKENRYVKSVTLNGRPLEGFILRHEDIMSGGELVFEMTSDLTHDSGF